MTDELKRCPFCGGTASESEDNSGQFPQINYGCGYCMIYTWPKEDWNNRPIEDALRSELAVMTADRDNQMALEQKRFNELMTANKLAEHWHDQFTDIAIQHAEAHQALTTMTARCEKADALRAAMKDQLDVATDRGQARFLETERLRGELESAKLTLQANDINIRAYGDTIISLRSELAIAQKQVDQSVNAAEEVAILDDKLMRRQLRQLGDETRHWEGRAIKAEAELTAANQRLALAEDVCLEAQEQVEVKDGGYRDWDGIKWALKQWRMAKGE